MTGGLLAVQGINHFLTHHQQENELSISDQKVIVAGKTPDMSSAIY